jgi:hypothetical protein
VTDRAVSTVLDVSLCLLLVGTAVLTLAAAPTPQQDPAAGSADGTASTLAATEVTVDYERGDRTRHAHGSLAGLLADAAVANGTPGEAPNFTAAVTRATLPALAGEGWHGQVVATWRPYEGAERGGTVLAGPDPPAGADVHAATMRVPSGIGPASATARSAATRAGYPGVAAALADAVVGVTGDASRERYVRETATALERRFDSPRAAARSVRAGTVRITVRTWSP